MYRYQILIEYVGTDFIGWQTQLKGRSVQKFLQIKISKLLKQKIIIIGSLEKFLKSINFFVNNKSISIIKIKKKTLKFHARYSAKKRIYKYVIFNQLIKPSLEKNRGWHISKKLDLDLMKLGAKKL